MGECGLIELDEEGKCGEMGKSVVVDWIGYWEVVVGMGAKKPPSTRKKK